MSHGQRPVYTHGHHESVLRSHQRRTAEDSAAYLLPHLKSGLSVLDIGCGPGTITADLAARVAPGAVTAVDQVADVLDVARAAAVRRNLTNVSFATADVHRLEFPDNTFDVVHAHQVLQHVADPVQALREMRRVCRPGGCVAIIWPNHLPWLTARGYEYVSFPGPMSVQFGSYAEAVELAEIFYPRAAQEVRRLGQRSVPFEVLGINPPRDLMFKVMPG